MIPGVTNPCLGNAGGGNVEPDAVDWANVTDTGGTVNTSTKTISGIEQQINMRLDLSSVVISPSGAVGYVYIYNHLSQLLGSRTFLNGNTPQIEFGHINPDDGVWFQFTAENANPWNYTLTATVKYKSNGSGSYDQTLDTFTVTLSGSGSGGGGGDPF